MIRTVKRLLKKIIPLYERIALRTAWRKISWPFYIGSKYHCPCCKTWFRKFLAFWGRDNIRCPKCNSIDRYRLLWLYLQNRTKILSEKLGVLHFAPEATLFNRLKRTKNLNYVTADLMVSFIEGVCAKPDYFMSVCEIIFPDNSFDVILCNHVLEHVVDDLKAMREIYRVLKKGGWAILQVPLDKSIKHTLENPNIISDKERNKFYGSPHHVRLYGRDYFNRLEEAGFKVIIDCYVKELSPLLVKKYRLDPDEDLYIVYK